MSRAYPSQYEAEACLDLMHALQGSFVGYCREGKTNQIRQKAINELNDHFNDIFNSPEKSPWEIVRKKTAGRGTKLKEVIQWREGWEVKDEEV